MKLRLGFRPYSSDDREVCLGLFDANCSEFFAPNERADYSRFLERNPVGYEVCFIGDKIAGAFGLIGAAEERQRLNWIMLDPALQGLGIGRAIMERVSTLATQKGLRVVEIAASHKSAPFFAKFGAIVLNVTQDGWGQGMHRVDMELLLMSNESMD